MTQTAYANAIINTMLGWLKWLANWVLKLFNLAGGGSPLEWLSKNWLKLLILLMIIGVVTDFVVWMLRWRPYWAWFKKKRIIVNDERMLAGEALENFDQSHADVLAGRSYVVKSRKPASAPTKRTTSGTKTPVRTTRTANVKTAAAPKRRPAQSNSAKTKRSPQTERSRSFSLLGSRPIRAEQIDDEMFETGHSNSEYTDYDQDQVFDVSNLPGESGSKREHRRRN